MKPDLLQGPLRAQKTLPNFRSAGRAQHAQLLRRAAEGKNPLQTARQWDRRLCLRAGKLLLSLWRTTLLQSGDSPCLRPASASLEATDGSPQDAHAWRANHVLFSVVGGRKRNSDPKRLPVPLFAIGTIASA